MSRDQGVGMAKTLIIMPAWNEEEVIGATITELRSVLPDYDLLVVNDGSTDTTVRVAERAGSGAQPSLQHGCGRCYAGGL